MSEHNEKTNYDSEPVKYCARCYSLKIKHEDLIDTDYCAECGCSDTKETSIEEWEKLYESKYGHRFTVKSNDPRKSPIFKMSVEKLKRKLYESPFWETVIKDLYRYPPKGLSKVDKILWFFDRIIRDNKIDEMKISIIKHLRNKSSK